jgi:hypothetical protein
MSTPTDTRAPATRTLRDEIRSVPDRWREQYYVRHGRSWSDTLSGSSKSVWKRLKALDLETASPEDVEKIIGNRSWTTLECDQCGREVDAVVEVGQSQGRDSRTADICADCIRKAADLFGSET